jgi:excisionase family DNA binding protein
MSGMRKPVVSVRPQFAVIGRSAAPQYSSSVFEPLLDLHEAAEVLGMHWKTLEGKARQHEVPAFKVGKRWRFRLSSLNNWLENGLKSNTTDHAVLTGQEQRS